MIDETVARIKIALANFLFLNIRITPLRCFCWEQLDSPTVSKFLSSLADDSIPFVRAACRPLCCLPCKSRRICISGIFGRADRIRASSALCLFSSRECPRHVKTITSAAPVPFGETDPRLPAVFHACFTAYEYPAGTSFITYIISM
ncbi:hypothetical protein SDC9_54870 [bioreactor metagenome]|uniref:Uncharacterized protein n=1 Tax=bioreactor metagenome TaxID=1076179 RepID=A0A644WXX7_9ZZZZ